MFISMWLRTWRRLLISLTALNESTKLELSGAWEPSSNSCTSQFGEVSRAQTFVSDGDKT
jgi:hypothetical protein